MLAVHYGRQSRLIFLLDANEAEGPTRAAWFQLAAQNDGNAGDQPLALEAPFHVVDADGRPDAGWLAAGWLRAQAPRPRCIYLNAMQCVVFAYYNSR